MGVRGAAACFLLSQFLNAFISTIYILFKSPIQESIFYFNKKSFKKLEDFITDSALNTISFSMNFCGFQCFALVAIFAYGLEYYIYVLINSLMMNFWFICLGFSHACCILTKEYLNHANKLMMLKTKKVCLIYGFLVMLVIGILIILLKHYLLFIFIPKQNSLAINNEISICFIFVGISLKADVLLETMKGYFNGLGKEKISTLFSFLNYFVLMFIWSLILTSEFELKIVGIFIAYLIGVTISNVIYFSVENKIDYSLLLKEANERIATERGKSSDRSDKGFSSVEGDDRSGTGTKENTVVNAA